MRISGRSLAATRERDAQPISSTSALTPTFYLQSPLDRPTDLFFLLKIAARPIRLVPRGQAQPGNLQIRLRSKLHGHDRRRPALDHRSMRGRFLERPDGQRGDERGCWENRCGLNLAGAGYDVKRDDCSCDSTVSDLRSSHLPWTPCPNAFCVRFESVTITRLYQHY